MDALLVELDFVLTEAHWSNAFLYDDSEAYLNLSEILSDAIDKIFSLWMDLTKNVIHVSISIEKQIPPSDDQTQTWTSCGRRRRGVGTAAGVPAARK